MADTDRELLEAAAKAAGIEIARSRLDDPLRRDMLIVNEPEDPQDPGRLKGWNPLTNSGDALELAVKLGIQVLYSDFSGEAEVKWDRGFRCFSEYGPNDPMAATRRAIVRAAAALGGFNG